MSFDAIGFPVELHNKATVKQTWQMFFLIKALKRISNKYWTEQTHVRYQFFIFLSK